MRWARSAPPDWKRWWAWYPVLVYARWNQLDVPMDSGYWVWGEWIERKRLGYIDGVGWFYRPVRENNENQWYGSIV